MKYKLRIYLWSTRKRDYILWKIIHAGKPVRESNHQCFVGLKVNAIDAFSDEAFIYCERVL